jgi:peroxiredoxin
LRGLIQNKPDLKSKVLGMKKIRFLLIVVVFMVACSSEPHYVVKGKIAGSDNITFYLQKRESGKLITLDSALSKKGSFTIKGGRIEYPQPILLVAGDTRMRTSFYLENSEISVTGSLDSLFNATITGSKTQDEYNSFVTSNKPLSDRYSKIILSYQAASQARDTANVMALQKQADSIQTEMINLQKSFVKNNPASYFAPSLLSSLSYQMEASEIEEAINAMNTAVAAIPQMKSLKERLAVMKAVAIGQKAPDFSLNTVDGKPVSLSSKIGSKLLLIDFWAAWCNPCREENPRLVKVYNEYHKKGFDVFGVSLDQSKEDWIKAIADDKLTWTQVSDLKRGNSAAAQLYAVISIPSNFLLDEKGTIIGRNLRGEELYNKVKEVLGTNK